MKKLLKFTSLIVSLILSLSILPACNNSSTTTDATLTQKTVNSSKVELYNFESWKPDFSCIKMSKLFGVVRRNKNKEFCKSGDYSAKVMPIGGHIDRYIDAPYLWFPTVSEAWQFDCQDFTYVDYVSCWVYNANDEEKAVTIGLVDNYVTHEKEDRLLGKQYILQPNCWTQLILPIDFSLMASTIDYELISSSSYSFSKDSIKKIAGVYFWFDQNVEVEEEYAPVYYFDDLTLVYKGTPNDATPIDLYDASSQTKTMLDFESVWQNDVLDITLYNYITKPLGRVVDDKNLSVKATSGRRMFELTFDLFKYSTQDQYKGCDPSLQYWSSVVIPEYLVRAFYKAYVYNAELENPYIIPRESWKDWYLSYDVYNANAVEYNFDLRAYTKGEKNNIICKTSGCVPNEWVTIRISLEDIASNELRITDSGMIRILWQTAPGTGADGKQDLVSENFTHMKYYLDSFRLEQI